MASPMDENALREATYAYVDETKRHGWPVERVIIEIKRLSEVEDAPLSRALRDPMQRDKAHALIDSVIGWCIARYFSTG